MLSLAILVSLLAAIAFGHSPGVFAIRFKHTQKGGGRAEVLERHASSLLTPASHSHRSVAELGDELRAPADHVAAVERHIADRWDPALPSMTLRRGMLGDILFVDLGDEVASRSAHLAVASRLFGSKGVSSTARYGRIPLAVPPTLQPLVDDILWLPPPSARPKRGAKTGGQFPGINESPLTIASLYAVPVLDPVLGGASKQAVAEFEGEQFYQSDLQTFGNTFNLSAIPEVTVVGPNNGGYFDEGILDLEYIVGVASGAPTYWVAKNTFDILGLCDMVFNITPVVPQVLSISWGSGESTYEQGSMMADNDEFKKLGLIGVSVLVASGDDGTGAQSTSIWGGCDKFDPNFPASATFCTAVGATYTNALGQPELGWSGSGGGFSAVFQPAGFQATAVQGYIRSGVAMPPSNLFNVSGRPVPDVAAVGTNFRTCSMDYWGVETGTSAATPTFAALITRINAKRMAAGKPSIGFLNPYLYQFAEQNGGTVGQDITSGNNLNAYCTAGFNCASGWDPVTGLGTPHFPSLEAYLLAQ